jgi:hypothetical protein
MWTEQGFSGMSRTWQSMNLKRVLLWKSMNPRHHIIDTMTPQMMLMKVCSTRLGKNRHTPITTQTICRRRHTKRATLSWFFTPSFYS